MEKVKLLIRKILSESFLREDDDDIDWGYYEMYDEIKGETLRDFAEKVQEHKKKHNCIYIEPKEKYDDSAQLSLFNKDEYLVGEEPEPKEPYWDCSDAEDDSNFNYHFEGRQPWTLLPIQTLKNVWMRFATTAPGLDIPQATIKTLNKIVNTIVRNIIKVDINTEMTGHKTHGPDSDELGDYNLIEKEVEMWWGDYCSDGMQGQMRISDFALDKLMEKVEELRSEDDPHKRLQIADATLEIVHMRSDIAGWFVKGGSRALSDLSGYDRKQVAEVRQFIRKILL